MSGTRTTGQTDEGPASGVRRPSATPDGSPGNVAVATTGDKPRPDPEPDADYRRIFAAQRANRWKLKASGPDARVERLARLRDAVLAHADEVAVALAADLSRPADGPVSLEVAVVLADLQDAIDHVAEWMSPASVHPSPLLPGSPPGRPETFVQYEARGVTLIFGA